MFKGIWFLLIVCSVSLGMSGCSSTSPVDQKKPGSSSTTVKSLTDRFPTKIPEFTLQSATVNGDTKEAQALYKPKKNEHVYSIVVIKEFSSSKEAEQKIKNALGEQGDILTFKISDSSAWSTFVQKPDLTCYLGVVKDSYAIEIDTHFTMSYKGDEDELRILARDLAQSILRNWQ